MNRLPCPNCGAALDCSTQVPGQSITCPACATALRLELEAEGTRSAGSRRSWRKRIILLILLVSALSSSFVAGGGLGFLVGHEAAVEEAEAQQPGIHLSAVGFFGAHNEVRITDNPAPPAPATTPKQRLPR